MKDNKLHLLAYDKEDFDVISSILQDSIVPVIDMYYSKIDSQFLLTASRFSNEDYDKKKQTKRIIFGVCFEKVDKVKKRNFPSNNKENILNLLSISYENDFISLLFSNDIELKLFGNAIFLRLDDLDKQWPTIFIPKHR